MIDPKLFPLEHPGDYRLEGPPMTREATSLVHSTWFFGGFAVMACLVSLTVRVDLAVAATAPNNPYSPLWFLLNPFYETQTPYRVYLAVFSAAALGAMLYAHRYHGLPVRVVWMQTSAMLALPLLHLHGSLTVVAFAWTAWYVPAMALLALQKLPIGWSWDLSDAHYKCLDSCYQYANPHPNGLFGVFYRDMDHDVLYVFLVLVVLYPIMQRLWARRQARKATAFTVGQA